MAQVNHGWCSTLVSPREEARSRAWTYQTWTLMIDGRAWMLLLLSRERLPVVLLTIGTLFGSISGVILAAFLNRDSSVILTRR